MGILKKITDEYFGKTTREEDYIDITGMDYVEILSFTDKNGTFHKHGYRIKDAPTASRKIWNFKRLINKIIENNGNHCSLNCVDTSNMEYMTVQLKGVFEGSDFDGDISGWDVSNVVSMNGMFAVSQFTGKNGIFRLEEGNKLENMADMFINSKFDGNISDWDVSGVKNMYRMFEGSCFSGDISGWNVREDCMLKNMFKNTPITKAKKTPSWYREWCKKVKGTLWES